MVGQGPDKAEAVEEEGAGPRLEEGGGNDYEMRATKVEAIKVDWRGGR